MSGAVEYAGNWGQAEPDTISFQRACQVLGVSRRTLYYWIKDGRVRTRRTMQGSQRVLTESVRMAAVRQSNA